MATQPNTNIVLCSGVPLDSSYNHTLTWTAQAYQIAYFFGKGTHNINLNSYQRVGRNKLRIQLDIDSAMDCNYLYFRNIYHENKYFYAFITQWTYINEVTTEITYEIDVFQTYYFDMDIKQCFIEREHIAVDTVGANTVPETLEQGEYVVNTYGSIEPPTSENTSACVLFYTTFNDDSTCSDFYGGFASNVYTGLNVIIKNTVNDIQDLITRATNNAKIDGIIAAYMCPFYPTSWNIVSEIKTCVKKQSGYLGTPTDPYQPMNNKLYTYPYNILRVHNDVESAEFRYEDFSGDSCQFYVQTALIPEPTLTATPYQYKGKTLKRDERLSCSKYPQVGVNVDVFKVYLAQNAASLAVGAISAVATTGAKLIGLAAGGLAAADALPVFGYAAQSTNMSGNSIGVDPASTLSAANSLTGIAQSLAQLYDLSRKPPQMNGSQTSAADYGLSNKILTVEYLTIKAEYARIIDKFFSMFGYATHTVKVPNITGRPYWNYVKTRGAIVLGNIPQVYLQKIIQCLDNGITFWHNADNIGNYSLDNRPT